MEKVKSSLTLLQELYEDDDEKKEEENENETLGGKGFDEKIENGALGVEGFGEKNEYRALGAEGFGEVEFVDILSWFEVQDFGENDVNPYVMDLEMDHHERNDITHPQEEEDSNDDEDDDKGSLEFQRLYDLAFKNKKLTSVVAQEEDDDADDEIDDDDDVDNQEEDVEQVQAGPEVEIDIDYKQF